jgi:hypothetical protein
LYCVPSNYLTVFREVISVSYKNPTKNQDRPKGGSSEATAQDAEVGGWGGQKQGWNIRFSFLFYFILFIFANIAQKLIEVINKLEIFSIQFSVDAYVDEEYYVSLKNNVKTSRNERGD